MEHRLIPLSLDTDGDVAAIVFARRLPGAIPGGHPSLETWIFQLCDGEWLPLGGGGTTLRAYPLTGRPPAAEQDGYLGQLSSGFVTSKPGGRLPWGRRGVFHAQFRAAAEVDKVQAEDRLLTVPFHGYAVIVWQGRRAPAVTAVAADGSQLASLNPNLDHARFRTALRRRLRRPVPRRQLAPGVAQYGPGLRSRPR